MKEFFKPLPALVAGLFFILVLSFSSIAQVTVSPATAAQMAQALVGSGISVSNATITNGTANAYGLFQANGAPIGINAGVVLTTGDINNIIGPNNSGSTTTNNFGAGDPQLTALSGYNTLDAVGFEFDLIPTADTLKFNYIFGSEEYAEWVGAQQYNDVFGFFISGPGIVGQQNIALIPGTTTPVSINNINCQGANPSYYICNDPNNSICPGSANCPPVGTQTALQYDGLTVLLQAKIVIQPCQTYHLRLGIADCTDGSYDSGVMIEAGSLSSTGVQITPITGYVDPNNQFSTAVEGCVDGQFQMSLNTVAQDTIVFHFGIGGTATMGTDYNSIPDSVVFYPGDSVLYINITPVADGLTEGIENIVLFQLITCNGNPFDSSIMDIADQILVSSPNDTAVCFGEPVQLNAISGSTFNYNWSPPIGLSCSNCDSALATPPQSTTYTITVTVNSCTAMDSTSITVNSTNANAGPDIYLCIGDSIQLNGSGGINYQWSPPTNLSATNISNPWTDTQDTITYYLDASIPIVGCNTQDTLVVYSVASLNGAAGNDTTICRGESPMHK